MFVSGCHRSGTSYLSMMLSSLVTNARKGDLELTVDNPRGYFESTLLRELNDRLLEMDGYSWDRPPLGRMSWCQGRFLLEGVRIKNEFKGYAASRDWVDKDPRLCITYPFYSHILLERRPIAISLRDPMEVAGSLYLRDGFSFEKGLLIWFLYNRGCADFLDEEADVVVDYSRLLEGEESELEGVASFLLRSRYSIVCEDTDLQFNLARVHTECSSKSLKRVNAHNSVDGYKETRIGQYCIDIYECMRKAKRATNQFKSAFSEVPSWIVDSYHRVMSEGEPSLEFHRVLERKGISVECSSGSRKIDEELISTYSDLILTINELKNMLPENLGKERLDDEFDMEEFKLIKERLQAMESSSSWKMTAPLREIMRKLREIGVR